MKRITAVWLALLLCFLLTVPTVGAEETADAVALYVSPMGNDHFPGTENYPFATVAKAVRTVSLLEEKTVVYLREGEYREPLEAVGQKTVLYRAYPGETAVLRTESGAVLRLEDCEGVTVQGLTLIGGDGAETKACRDCAVYDCNFVSMKRGISIEGDLCLEGNRFSGLASCAVTVQTGDPDTLTAGHAGIVNNLIGGFTSDHETVGIDLYGVGAVAEHNGIDGAQIGIRLHGNKHFISRNDLNTADPAILSEEDAADNVIGQNRIGGTDGDAAAGSFVKQTQEFLQQSVLLLLGSSRAVCRGKGCMIDPNNPDVTAFTREDRTFLPVRFLAECLGAEVTWIAEEQKVCVTRGDRTVELWLGSDVMTVNGEERLLDVAAFEQYDRTFLPLRAIAEALDTQVYWDTTGLIALGGDQQYLEHERIRSAIFRTVANVF